MVQALAAPTFFMLSLQPTFPCSNKPKYSRGKGNSNSAHATMVHGKEDIEAAPKKRPNQHLNMESTRKIDGVYDSFGGKLSHDGRVFTQNFAIRSYELGPDGRASLGSLIQRLQVAAIYFGFLFLSMLRSYISKIARYQLLNTMLSTKMIMVTIINLSQFPENSELG